MSEIKNTLSYVGVALVLVITAYLSSPKASAPDYLSHVGETFFPEFTDPNEAASLEVITYDPQTASAKPFKVVFKENLWVIPSQYNYPADGKEQLSKTAAGLIALKKEEFRTHNPDEFEALGVVDPLDETQAKGRGKRITIRNKNDKILADIIVGKALDGKSERYFVREVGKKEVYAAKIPFKISTAFRDWIDTDVIQVEKSAISEVVLKDYSINEVTRSVNQRGQLKIEKSGKDWLYTSGKGAAKKADNKTVEKFLAALDQLSIVGVRPKPQGLSEHLTRSESEMRISKEDLLSLQSKGYYFSRNGELLSNEGELSIKTTDGIQYVLRFGEMVLDQTTNSEKPVENRFLFITAAFDETAFPEPAKPKNLEFQSKPDSLWSESDKKNKKLNEAHEKWQQQLSSGKEKSSALAKRFADWYYIISENRFKTLELNPKDL